MDYSLHNAIGAIATAPRDGILIRFWCRSKVEPMVGYYRRICGEALADRRFSAKR
jgi:hypothetical protein